MAKKIYSMRFSDNLMERIDRHANFLGLARNAVIEDILEINVRNFIGDPRHTTECRTCKKIFRNRLICPTCGTPK